MSQQNRVRKQTNNIIYAVHISKYSVQKLNKLILYYFYTYIFYFEL